MVTEIRIFDLEGNFEDSKCKNFESTLDTVLEQLSQDLDEDHYAMVVFDIGSGFQDFRIVKHGDIIINDEDHQKYNRYQVAYDDEADEMIIDSFTNKLHLDTESEIVSQALEIMRISA